MGSGEGDRVGVTGGKPGSLYRITKNGSSEMYLMKKMDLVKGSMMSRE